MGNNATKIKINQKYKRQSFINKKRRNEGEKKIKLSAVLSSAMEKAASGISTQHCMETVNFLRNPSVNPMAASAMSANIPNLLPTASGNPTTGNLPPGLKALKQTGDILNSLGNLLKAPK